MKSLYVFTGKGGVGKTTLSLAFAYELKKEGKSPLYMYFEPNVDPQKYNILGIEHEQLNFLTCVQYYIAKKLKSQTVAKWVIKAPFFKALVNMVPGFNYLIYLGYILDHKLKKNPNMVVILDSPSSGHALTMFEACFNFREIFQHGVLVDDINKMLDYIFNEDILKINILALPSPMPINEAMELKKNIEKMNYKNCHLYINNAMGQIVGIDQQTGIPPFLQKKLSLEKEILMANKNDIKGLIAHSTKIQFEDIVKDLAPFTQILK